MKRKLLPVFLSFALLANGSLTAFAADPVADAVTESDVQTTVSEDQENQEEVTVPEGETSEEEKEEASVEGKEETSVEENATQETEKSDADDAQTAVDLETKYKELTFGNPVSDEETVNAIGNKSVAILDVRTAESYNAGHFSGSISIPVFANGTNGPVPAKTSNEELAQSFTKYVTDHKAELEGKDLYILCYSGNRGARAASVLLSMAGYDTNKIHTITGGAASTSINFQYNMINSLNVVNGEGTVKAVGDNNVAILDVRAAENYAVSHLKGALSAPVFANGDFAKKTDDALATSFAKYAADHKAALNGKTIYILCNSGSRGAQAATVLLRDAGYDMSKVYTVTGGYNENANIQAAAIYATGARAVQALSNSNELVLDVRSAEAYAANYLKGSLSLSLFDKDNNLTDDLEKAFREYVTAHKAELAGKQAIYVLCNSGSRGAEKALRIFNELGITSGRIIENGAKDGDIQAAFTKVSTGDANTDNNKTNDNKQNTNKTAAANTTATANTTKTGDTAPIAALAVVMLAALSAIITFGKKKIVK